MQSLQRDRENVVNQTKIDTLVKLRVAYSNWGAAVLTSCTSEICLTLAIRRREEKSYMMEVTRAAQTNLAASDSAHAILLCLESNLARKNQWNEALERIDAIQLEIEQEADSDHDINLTHAILSNLRIALKKVVAQLLHDISKAIQKDIDSYQENRVKDVSVGDEKPLPVGSNS